MKIKIWGIVWNGYKEWISVKAWIENHSYENCIWCDLCKKCGQYVFQTKVIFNLFIIFVFQSDCNQLNSNTFQSKIFDRSKS